MTLGLDVRQDFAGFQLKVAMELGAGLTALIGASGSGKTTLLNTIAGVLRPAHAVVTLDEDVLVDTTRGTWTPAHRRRLGYVFQEPRLFPHLTVRQNLTFARWFQRGQRNGHELEELVRLLNLESLLQRYPSRLSGGEKQRVALGRALLSRPRWLLLDEPLGSVDRAHRDEILKYLDRIRAEHEIPAIYVTHTWSEVAHRADHVVELDAGRVVFSGPASAAPR